MRLIPSRMLSFIHGANGLVILLVTKGAQSSKHLIKFSVKMSTCVFTSSVSIIALKYCVFCKSLKQRASLV